VAAAPQAPRNGGAGGGVCALPLAAQVRTPHNSYMQMAAPIAARGQFARSAARIAAAEGWLGAKLLLPALYDRKLLKLRIRTN